MSDASRWVMARPSPVPPSFCCDPSADCSKGSQRGPWNAGSIPTPVSATVTTTVSASARARTVTDPPSPVYVTTLLTRFEQHQWRAEGSRAARRRGWRLHLQRPPSLLHLSPEEADRVADLRARVRPLGLEANLRPVELREVQHGDVRRQRHGTSSVRGDRSGPTGGRLRREHRPLDSKGHGGPPPARPGGAGRGRQRRARAQKYKTPHGRGPRGAGCPGWIRTISLPVQSRTLCRLSYWASVPTRRGMLESDLQK